MRLVRHGACSFTFALVLEERRYQPTTTRCPPRQSTRPQTCKSSSIIHVSGNLNYATSPSSKAQDRFCLKDTFLIHAFPGRLAGAIRAPLVCSERYYRPKAETSKALSKKHMGNVNVAAVALVTTTNRRRRSMEQTSIISGGRR